ncbi:PEP/pyruvate-binding domain-containing protein [Hydrogenophaga sp.]|uniref:PEP/pyruvate-binding domain-containing protein n=1 Tax=Hydrogenophaga sp. TaxID=1904254 RepID=UPI0025BF4B96|nr:PEP/pyruvate-binding domain-containing protein [Hydrogenophaga sp.]
MSTLPHWPKHFYLVARDATPVHHQPTKENMGSKAHNLLRMTGIGLPVPPALVIGTHFTRAPEDAMLPLFSVGLPELETVTGLKFGDVRQPLILSVRSGAPVSMPGMMETLLNVGLCDATLPGLLRQTGNPRLVWDAYRRLIATYGEVVAGVSGALFEDAITAKTQGRDERTLDFSELRDLVQQFLVIYRELAGEPFPQDVNTQLSGAVAAVFASWDQPKAITYRGIHNIDERMGTAVTVQQMVFGNSGGHAGAGVGFTRNPTTGEPGLWVDFLVNAQGEDVVSGQRNAHGHAALEQVAPLAWQELQNVATRLEQHFEDMQDFEFTVQDGELYMLQTRSGKRTPLATARIALDLCDDGIIDTNTALERTAALRHQDLATLHLVAQGTNTSIIEPLASALPACNGVVSGEIALDAARAQERQALGVSAVLVRQDAQTSDIAALQSVGGLLTQRGARTSHAAVVARQMGKVCLVACSTLRIDEPSRCIQLGAQTLFEGDVITLDGNEGQVYAGKVETMSVADEALIERLRILRAKPADKRHPESNAPRIEVPS